LQLEGRQASVVTFCRLSVYRCALSSTGLFQQATTAAAAVARSAIADTVASPDNSIAYLERWYFWRGHRRLSIWLFASRITKLMGDFDAILEIGRLFSTEELIRFWK